MDDLAAWLTQVWDEIERVVSAPDVARLIAPTEAKDALAEYAVLDGELHASPASALARIAADRQILDVHGVAWNAEVCTVCHHLTGDDLHVDNDPWPCRTVRLLAQPYADRPGFRDEWRVTT